MKKYFLMAVAAIAALSSCTSDEELVSSNKVEDVKAFTATIVNENASRTILDSDNTPNWEVGDVISVDGHEYTADEAGTTTTFIGEGAAEATHHAYFPANLYNDGTPTLPAVQTYKAGKFNMPMYAESTTTELAFKNICAVLAVTVTSDDIVTLKSIKVSSDKAMCGAFAIDDDAAVLADASDNSKTVELVSEEALTMTSTGTTFYIAIPAREYRYLNIYLSSDGTTYKQAMATRKATGIGAIVRNKIFNIDYKANATQLWEDGPMFADVNVGVTDGNPESYGGCYAWGGISDNVDDPYTGSDSLTGNDDTATNLWGKAWRMPTSAELQALLDNCTYKWSAQNGVNGMMFTGNDDYTSNTIFLPAAGHHNGEKVVGIGTYCYYWSSTPNGSNKANRLYLNNTGYHVMGNFSRSYGCPVRAVLK